MINIITSSFIVIITIIITNIVIDTVMIGITVIITNTSEE